MGETIEVQIAEMAMSENVTSGNERNGDSSMEITGESVEPNSKVNSMPDVQIDECTDFKRSRYKRRMSKSCDELAVTVKPNTNSKWKSWNNFVSSLGNTMTRVRHGLSNSVSQVDQLVDTHQNEKLAEQNQD